MSVKNIKSRQPEIEIPEEEPFKNCALGRSKYASILTDIVSVYSQSGCVMALNGEWGSGKTTFVKMWRQYLNNQGFKTLYFNAWESDYVTDPLVAMLSELQELKLGKGSFDQVVSAAGKVVLAVGTAVSKGLLKKVTGLDSDAVGAALDEVSELGKESLKEYANQKRSFEEFKQSLIEFVASNTNEHPIVFFVDELDRCSPTYAVKVLERIKHLFDIPNIIFVLAVNKRQLECAIQGYFGSSKMDSEEYLHRFINIEYSLPEPDMEKYCEYLYKEYDFQIFFENKERLSHFSVYREREEFLIIASAIAESQDLSLRTTDKIFAYSRLALLEFASNTYLIPDVFFLLCFWKITSPDFYNAIRYHRITVQQLLEEVENTFPASILKVTDNDYNYKGRRFIFTIASLLRSYNIESGQMVEKTFVEKKVEGKEELEFPITCKVIDKSILNKALIDCRHDSIRLRKGLTFIFERIELLNTFEIN